ncbi:lasso peptide biosynthesis B2 protein [Sphingomonas sp. MMS24-J45]|uniref:lasso peptide biosynthesis B2 protein n=1 Tax=Sphingomonas sp. MMS24-J45 TaxID=3238806 RepID=UPI00384C1220
MILEVDKSHNPTKRGWRDYCLAAEAFCLLLVMALAIRLLPFSKLKAIASYALGERKSDGVAERDLLHRIRWAIAAAARRSPLRAKCFEQGLAAQVMLRGRGVDSTLFYGLARGDLALEAHVWVVAGSVPICGTRNAGEFSALLRLPPQPTGSTPAGVHFG